MHDSTFHATDTPTVNIWPLMPFNNTLLTSKSLCSFYQFRKLSKLSSRNHTVVFALLKNNADGMFQIQRCPATQWG